MLGTMKMTRLVPKVSVPIMISMLVQAMYNVVDSIFVAQHSAEGLTAVSLAYPLQMLMIAVSTGLGVGINSLISRKLGEKRHDEAIGAARNGMFLQVCGFALFMAFGLLLARPFFTVMTDDPVLQELGGTYLSIVCTASFGLFLSITLERMMQATGNAMLSMATQMTGAIVNIILDPIMIFGLLGCPEMGVAGAAVATVIGQISGMTLGFYLNQKKNIELRLTMKDFRPDKGVIGAILGVGFPSIIMQSISSVMNVLFNMILMPFGNAAVNVLGVYFKLQSFIFMPVFGLSNGMVAVVGYNFGARLRKRVYEAIRVALTIAVCIMIVGTVLFMAVPETMLSLFESGDSREMTEIGVVALRVISSCFVFAAVGIMLSTVFQAVGKGVYSLWMSLCRQLVVLIPSAWLFAQLGGVNAVWWSFPFAEIVSLVMSLVLFRRVDQKMLKNL